MVKVRGLTLGDGAPKICVPLVGATESELAAEAAAAKAAGADMLEWRVDFYSGADDFNAAEKTAAALRVAAGETPLLFTFRTKKEGGAGDISVESYAALNTKMVCSGYIDLVDAELFTGDSVCRDIVNVARKNGVKVILSNHDFEKTPPRVELTERLMKMRDLGADIPKIAVMPQSPADVLELFAATLEASERLDCPVITMSMGELGVITRVSGEFSGSCVTFGTVESSSAPGQLRIDALRTALAILKR